MARLAEKLGKDGTRAAERKVKATGKRTGGVWGGITASATTCSPSALTDGSEAYGEFGVLLGVIEAPPAALPGFLRDAQAIANSLTSQPVSADGLLRARRPLIERLQRDRAGNAWWLNALNGVRLQPQGCVHNRKPDRPARRRHVGRPAFCSAPFSAPGYGLSANNPSGSRRCGKVRNVALRRPLIPSRFRIRVEL